MPLLQILIVSNRGGCSAWAGQPLHTNAATIKSILNAVVVIVVVLWLLNIFGLLHSLSGIHVGK